MTFVYGTQMELLYCMPAVGATKTTTAVQVVSGTTTGAPAFQLPALQNLWSPANMAGKGLKFVARGTSDNTAVANTLAIGVNTAQGTAPTAIVLASTGATVWPSSTIAAWEMECDSTCIASTNASSTWVTAGVLTVGSGNNGSTPTAATAFMVGGANTLGVPSGVVLVPTTSYFVELTSLWATAPTAFVCSQFMIYGMN